MNTGSGDVRVSVNGAMLNVPAGITVAAALVRHDDVACRKSVTGEVRGPLCGMGTCFECRVTIDGIPHRRACMTLVRDGMTVERAASR